MMRTYIHLKNLKFYAYHGVLPQERIVGNDFVVNLKIEVDITPAFASDLVEDTINYADVFDLIKAEMQIPSDLLEHLAGRIYKKLKDTYPQVASLELRVGKHYPPVSGEMERAEVVICDSF